MTYEVEWSQRAINQLAEIWGRSTDREAVTIASHALDQVLGRDPEDIGESRPDDQRITFATPLGVLYEVDTRRRHVLVISCWWFRQR